MNKNIRINFLGIKGFCLKNKIKKIYNTVANLCNIEQEIIVNLGYVSESAIQKLNMENRNVDKVTDVLSFPFYNLKNGIGLEEELKDNKQDSFFGNIELGDILICESVAEKQAQDYGHSKKREVCFLATHGFLHLLGFDHLTEEDERLMNSIAEKALEICNVKRKK